MHFFHNVHKISPIIRFFKSNDQTTSPQKRKWLRQRVNFLSGKANLETPALSIESWLALTHSTE